MKYQLYIFFIIVLASGCATKDNGTIHIQCRKSFVFETNNEFNYYYVLNINNKTKEDIYLTNNGILFLQKNGEEKHLELKLGNVLLNAPFVQKKHTKEIWKITPNDSMKQIYTLNSPARIINDYIVVTNNTKITDSIKIPSYILLKEPMSFERSIYEVDGRINGEKPQINW